MDPQTTLNELIKAALAGQDYEAISDLAYALVDWHNKGGFVPDLKQALDASVERRRAMNAAGGLRP
jgi:hypothetical protein